MMITDPYDHPVDILAKAPFLFPETGYWVFAYGSLMWDPGFPVGKSELANIYGYHRRLCLWSIRYRGTRTRPGLVLGLAPGGSCRGMAFFVDSDHATSTAEYLQEREMISNAYRPERKRIFLQSGEIVEGLAFVSRVGHPQYATGLDTAKTVNSIKRSAGPRGKNSEYVLNTVAHLDELGIRDPSLHEIASHL